MRPQWDTTAAPPRLPAEKDLLARLGGMSNQVPPYNPAAPQPPAPPWSQPGQPGQPDAPWAAPGAVPLGQTPIVPPPPPAAYASGPNGRGDIAEKPAWYIGGLVALLIDLILWLAGIYCLYRGFSDQNGGATALGVLLVIIAFLLLSSIKIISPGDTLVLQFFGNYIGTIRRTGLVMTIPFTSARHVSVKVRNFETHELKVNDFDGNPVNIAAIIVWRVEDTAKAVFGVEYSEQFVAAQSESALRHIASSHPYDTSNPQAESLRGSTELIARELAEEVGSRVQIAGIQVIEARISSLAYAPEIAQAMLQRQQASALIAARQKIVEGAVMMVQDALDRLEQDNIVHLDDQHKASMVANLLVVLCSDSRATPVVNAGSPF